MKSGGSGQTAKRRSLAHDRWGIRLGRPTNLAFGGQNFDEIYVANLGRYTITRAKLGNRGQPLANMQGLSVVLSLRERVSARGASRLHWNDVATRKQSGHRNRGRAWHRPRNCRAVCRTRCMGACGRSRSRRRRSRGERNSQLRRAVRVRSYRRDVNQRCGAGRESRCGADRGGSTCW